MAGLGDFLTGAVIGGVDELDKFVERKGLLADQKSLEEWRLTRAHELAALTRSDMHKEKMQNAAEVGQAEGQMQAALTEALEIAALEPDSVARRELIAGLERKQALLTSGAQLKQELDFKIANAPKLFELAAAEKREELKALTEILSTTDEGGREDAINALYNTQLVTESERIRLEKQYGGRGQVTGSRIKAFENNAASATALTIQELLKWGAQNLSETDAQRAQAALNKYTAMTNQPVAGIDLESLSAAFNTELHAIVTSGTTPRDKKWAEGFLDYQLWSAQDDHKAALDFASNVSVAPLPIIDRVRITTDFLDNLSRQADAEASDGGTVNTATSFPSGFSLEEITEAPSAEQINQARRQEAQQAIEDAADTGARDVSQQALSAPNPPTATPFEGPEAPSITPPLLGATQAQPPAQGQPPAQEQPAITGSLIPSPAPTEAPPVPIGPERLGTDPPLDQPSNPQLEHAMGILQTPIGDMLQRGGSAERTLPSSTELARQRELDERIALLRADQAGTTTAEEAPEQALSKMELAISEVLPALPVKAYARIVESMHMGIRGIGIIPRANRPVVLQEAARQNAAGIAKQFKLDAEARQTIEDMLFEKYTHDISLIPDRNPSRDQPDTL
jgi:hypothetical protein